MPHPGEPALMPDRQFAGSFAVLGATGATGTAVAHLLHDRGADLVLLARDADRLRALAEPLGARTAVLSSPTAGPVAAALREAAGGAPLAGIAHCVGSLLLKPAHRTSEAEWQDVLDTNLSSAFGVTMAAAELLPQGGSVVFCSSVAATLGLANHEAIAAAKAGLIGLARAAAATHARRGIRFHCVAPALVASRMTESLLGRPGVAEAAAKQNPSGRVGRADDVARAIVFLLDPANNWLDGQVLGVDGGFGSLRPHP
ncbi:MAG: SDR family oxidoreductase [Planctomycetes bacterium]|nr:SDR family oxidoreductase [Planctomycetota bacterium]